MKLNPKSRYLMHLLPPLTGMVQAGLAWDKRHARLGQKGLDNRLRSAEVRGWPEAPLLKSATPYGARPAAMRMCRGMPTPPPTHLPRPCSNPLPRPRFWDFGSTHSAELFVHPPSPVLLLRSSFPPSSFFPPSRGLSRPPYLTSFSGS